MISHADLLNRLLYDSNTGIFTWKSTHSTRPLNGTVAGSLKKSGYTQIHIDNIIYQAHILAWFYVYGVWPEKELDHKNRIRSDNRIDNLRLASDYQQAHNRNPHPNSNGYIGVKKQGNKYQARLMDKGESFYLGLFDTAELAGLVRSEARDRLMSGKSFRTATGVANGK